MPACTSSLISCLDGHAPLGEEEFVELWRVLSTVPDPRDPRGVRHAFATILTLATAAVLAGYRSVAAIAAWAGDLPSGHQRRVGVRRRPPRLSTFARALAGVDPDVLDGVLGAWLSTRTSAPTRSSPASSARHRPWRPGSGFRSLSAPSLWRKRRPCCNCGSDSRPRFGHSLRTTTPSSTRWLGRVSHIWGEARGRLGGTRPPATTSSPSPTAPRSSSPPASPGHAYGRRDLARRRPTGRVRSPPFTLPVERTRPWWKSHRPRPTTAGLRGDSPATDSRALAIHVGPSRGTPQRSSSHQGTLAVVVQDRPLTSVRTTL
ncbi:hypothetical protein GALL_233530 [mine drainage metagenome]|uniref:H repeat-associated protein N-terminal domain-containing protein n=1 Tax=mine drainage metagenome TaxID=410659 RepID=A0A1J5RRU0_9ZZZZ